MDKIEKALQKFTPQERKRTKEVLSQLLSGKTGGLNLKKLKGVDDIFRVRAGPIRIVYRNKGGAISILLIERRSERTYRTIK